jgi:hypothetical protein
LNTKCSGINNVGSGDRRLLSVAKQLPLNVVGNGSRGEPEFPRWKEKKLQMITAVTRCAALNAALSIGLPSMEIVYFQLEPQ